MPRLYDEIIEIVNRNCNDTQSIYELSMSLPKAQIFMASNVHELISPNAFYNPAKDFPNAAPPFDVTWVEWSVSYDFANAIKFPELRRAGTMTTLMRDNNNFILHILGALEMMDSGTLSYSVFPGKAKCEMDALGNVIDYDILMSTNPKERGDIRPDAINGLIIPTLLTFSLMNCRNVTTQDVTPYKSEKKRWQKRGNARPLCRYHIINISTMARLLRDEGRIESNGPVKALHICRGHFKNYSENGLFGKHKGLFYFGPTIRGSKKGGIVLKDYNVRA